MGLRKQGELTSARSPQRVDEALDLVDLPERRAIAFPPSSRAECASASASRARSRCARSTSSTTSRPRGSIRSPAPSSTSSWSACATEARRHGHRDHARHAQRVHGRHAHRDAVPGTRPLGGHRSTRSRRPTIRSCASSSRDVRREDDGGVPGGAALRRLTRALDDSRPCQRETSAGGVVYRLDEGGPLFLLIRDSYQNWGFPEGSSRERRARRGRGAARGARGDGHRRSRAARRASRRSTGTSASAAS